MVRSMSVRMRPTELALVTGIGRPARFSIVQLYA
jgi:hypothetical protein